MLSVGRYTATIVDNDLKTTAKGSMCASLLMQIGEDQIECRVWLTSKTIRSGMAHNQLSRCGFDYAKTSLSELQANHKLLSGTKVPVIVETNEYNGQTNLQCSIDTNSVSAEQVSKVDSLLRSVTPKEGNSEDDEPLPF